MSIMERTKERRNFIIPILLVDSATKLQFKAVMLDISSIGIRIFSNDTRMLLANEDVLKQKTFDLEFDFFGLPTKNLKAQVKNISPGANPEYERRLGLEFIDIDPKVSRQIEEFLQEHQN